MWPSGPHLEENAESSSGDKNGHHIIPRHAGGPDQSWNMVELTTPDHQKAHELRYEVYQEVGDRVAVSFWANPTQNTLEAQQRRATITHEICRANKTGFFSPEQQSINGQKGGTVQTENKVEKYVEKLTDAVADGLGRDTRWKHRKDASIDIIHVKANTAKLVVDFQEIFVNALPEGEEKEKLSKMTTANFTSAVSKVFKGERKTAHNFTLLPDEASC